MRHQSKPSIVFAIFAPIVLFLCAFGLWWALCDLHKLPATVFPTPKDVWHGFKEELHSQRLWQDIIVSLWRVAAGFSLAVALGIPMGLWLGHSPWVRTALLPIINFFRNLSPLAWIGFAITWFGVGDPPAIFLIFLSVFFPMAVAVSSAVAAIPEVYFRVAHDFGIRGLRRITLVTLPAITPQLITALRVTLGIAWVVLVAAEMVGTRSGLGFAIYDDRNALRQDLLVVHMVVIGLIGVFMDKFVMLLSKAPSVQWGYRN